MEELPPKIPTGMQPDPKDVSFDLDLALSSVVSVRTEIPDDAFTAGSLGTVRRGHGVVIAEGGLILTIGYLIIEAASIWMLDANGRAIPGDVVGYDQETGFGLIRALDPAGLTPLPIGQSGDLSVGEKVIFAGNGGRTQALKSRVVSIREFAGYWEYLLDQAIFTSPPHPFWGGGALIGADGTPAFSSSSSQWAVGCIFNRASSASFNSSTCSPRAELSLKRASPASSGQARASHKVANSTSLPAAMMTWPSAVS